MPNASEPRFFRIAAVMADPTRARMLAALLGGEHRSAGELAAVANVTAQSASTQLAQLVDSGLVSVRSQGRHRYFALADAEVAHALEALSLVAERDPVSARWERPGYQPFKHARRCYSHLAGELGVAQFDMLMRCGHLQPSTRNPGQDMELSASGQAWMAELGMAAPARTGARFAYRCMDWSERKDHLAGSLSRALLEHYVERHWLSAESGSRALRITPKGQRELLPLLARAPTASERKAE